MTDHNEGMKKVGTQKTMLAQLWAVITIVLILFTSTHVLGVDFDSASVRIATSESTKLLKVEFARTFEQRAQGLMHRQSMCDDCGMLFRYTHPTVGSMWMKNTYIALDVAFISKEGVITDIIAMQPHDLTPISSSQKVLFALEMNQGWFAKQGIVVGDKVKVINE